MKSHKVIETRAILQIAMILVIGLLPVGCGSKNPQATTPDAIRNVMLPHLTASGQARQDAAAKAYQEEQARIRTAAIASHAAPAGVATAQPSKTQ
jgi:hypothetical protein